MNDFKYLFFTNTPLPKPYITKIILLDIDNGYLEFDGFYQVNNFPIKMEMCICNNEGIRTVYKINVFRKEIFKDTTEIFYNDEGKETRSALSTNRIKILFTQY
jgi:hypothetical protein